MKNLIPTTPLSTIFTFILGRVLCQYLAHLCSLTLTISLPRDGLPLLGYNFEARRYNEG